MKFHYYVPILFILMFTCINGRIIGQTCSESDLFQKYWQYKKRFNKHFIVQDRSPQGCVNDGIGFSNYPPENYNMSCTFSKQGFGLPATNLMISPAGWGIPGTQLNQRFDTNLPFPLLDRDCGGSISWGSSEDPGHRFNWIDYGSETLTQLGWHFVTLATEYELLGRNGQTEAQQKVLEDIFLGIQAIRRLDMQAQCLIKSMYDARRPGENLVCDEPFSATGFNGQIFNPPCHRHWDSHVQADCNFTPDFSGFNGFFLRADATQELEKFLHDSTDNSWNVDAVGGAFDGGVSAVKDCSPVDPFCWMVFTQHFISQDQLINLFYGFAFIKRYIPDTATVTTCNGEVFHPLEMVQRMSNAIVNRINDNGDHITLPGSDHCCEKIVKLSECEGGNLRLTIYGLLKTNEYIQGHSVRTTFMQQSGFEGVLANSPQKGLSFYLKESAMCKDFSEINNDKKRSIIRIAKDKNKEILILGNDLLFPEGEALSERLGGAEFFRNLLCDAPCGGPCHVDKGFSDSFPGPLPGMGWPSNFKCANTPGWEGSRWDGEGKGTDEGETGAPRKTNGLDYMALFNMYMLQYGTHDFYNPDAIESSSQLTLRNDINGPSILCPGELGIYQLSGIDPNDLLESLSWSSTPNIVLHGIAAISAVANFPAGTPENEKGTINASFTKVNQIPQFFKDGDELVPEQPPILIDDKCTFAYTKELRTGLIPDFDLITEIDPCAGIYLVWANPLDGSNPDRYNFSWEVQKNEKSGFSTGQNIDFVETIFGLIANPLDLPGGYDIKLTVTGDCGNPRVFSFPVFVEPCGHNDPVFQLGLSPNPTHNDIRVTVSSFASDGTLSDIELDPVNGHQVFIQSANGGPVFISTRVYQNNSIIPVMSLPDGYYDLMIDLDSNTQISRKFFLHKL